MSCTTMAHYLAMPLVKSTLVSDVRGRLWRVEVRRDETTGLCIRGRFPVPEGRSASQGHEERAKD